MTRTTEELLQDVQTKLELAKETFNKYSQLHAAKKTHDGMDKSIRNNLLACEMLLGLEALDELADKLREMEEELLNITASLGYFKEEDEYHKNQIDVICDVLRDISIDPHSFVEERNAATLPTPPKKEQD